MKQKVIIAGMICFMLIAMVSNGQTQDTKKKIRVGVYDNRAIAIAYFGSEYNPLVNMRIEFNTARATGDSARIKELEEWGPRFQRKVQFQGFCKVPVDDLLAYVKDKLVDVAKAAKLDLIGWSPTYMSGDIELVDITDKLVALYNPSADVLNEVAEILKVTPTELGDIVQVDYSKK